MSRRLVEARTVTVRAAAKINLQLGVGPVREDGYHPLATVYQAIGMYDDVTVAEADDWSLRVVTHERIDAAEVPDGDGNIALRAAHLLADHHGIERAAAIGIEKSIPVAGGLAGGSADAAATLLALDRLWHLHSSDSDLLELAARLGSDVPFALVGGSARGGGRGELVERVPDRGAWWWVVVESDIGLSTPRVYAEFDRQHAADGSGVPTPRVREDLLVALRDGDPVALAATLTNDLQQPALALRPDLAAVLDLGVEAGALAGIVSGSGPTCVFLCADAETAHEVRSDFDEAGFARVQVAAGPVAGAHEVTYE